MNKTTFSARCCFKKIRLTIAFHFLSLFSILLFSGYSSAQTYPYTFNVFDEVLFYDGYAATVSDPVPSGILRLNNACYTRKLTDVELSAFGNKLTMNLTIKASCDNYDRIGNVNLAFVPKNSVTYSYNGVERIEIGRYITPFMNKNVQPDEVPYTFTIDNVAQIFKNQQLLTQYDIWVELELFGVPYAANQQIAGCSGRNDVFFGTLDFVTDFDSNLTYGTNFLLPMAFKYLLRNYTINGTDVLGQTTKSITFTLNEDVQNAQLHLITSNHGANSGGEEYVRRTHYINFDNTNILTYMPGGVSCVPYRVYNTQLNCIYYNCSTGQPLPNTNAAWSWNNWCPGDKIPTRIINLGDLAQGTHTFNINVPTAVFNGGQGEFPMSVYLQGETQILSSENFTKTTTINLSPNPVKDILTINTKDAEVVAVTVFSVTGKEILESTSKSIDFSSLQSGLYLVKIELSNSETITKKVIKN